ncbi:trypsin-like peptidase domain-containing protein [bacterium]|nr:MAG: trypsin-like peptidase domain-containing protein [bacterium]
MTDRFEPWEHEKRDQSPRAVDVDTEKPVQQQRWHFRAIRNAGVMVLVGALAGAGGAYGYTHYLAASIPVDRKQLIIEESSAVIDVATQLSPSVVSITSKTVARGFFGYSQEVEGAGTGMVLTADGLILTNRHVVDDTTATYTVVMNDGKTYPATVVSRDTKNDVAFVRVEAKDLTPVNIGDSGKLKVGQQVVAIGNALGQFQNSVTEGIISGVSRGITAGSGSAYSGMTEELSNLLQTDAAINSGNSGGPLVDLEGQVIGMNTAVAGSGAQNIGFAIPINDIKPLIESVKSKGRIVRPYLGVRYVALTRQVATLNNLTVSDGAWIQASGDANPGVVSGSPAEKAGVKEGDIITKIGDDTVDATHSLQSLIGKYKTGDKVKLTIIRDSATVTVEATLEDAPAGS